MGSQLLFWGFHHLWVHRSNLGAFREIFMIFSSEVVEKWLYINKNGPQMLYWQVFLVGSQGLGSSRGLGVSDRLFSRVSAGETQTFGTYSMAWYICSLRSWSCMSGFEIYCFHSPNLIMWLALLAVCFMHACNKAHLTSKSLFVISSAGPWEKFRLYFLIELFSHGFHFHWLQGHVIRIYIAWN